MHANELEAIRKACLYSLPPNKLGFCGEEQSWLSFQKFLSNPTEESLFNAKNSLQSFNALFPYLELIAEENSLNPFDGEVIEAYWIGNRLLENISLGAMQKTVLSFQKFGLPKRIVKQKAFSITEDMTPHHSFHVLHVNFISKKVKPVVKNLSNCLVLWGKVKKIEKGKIVALCPELFLESNQLKLRECEKRLENPFNLSPSKSTLVSVHWENAVEEISQKMFKDLRNYSFKNLEAVNAYGFNEKSE